MTKKIILLLVEGLTDEEALALVFSKLAKEHDIEFDVLHTDITADENMTVKYIGERIKREIADYLRKNPFIKRKDILKVVQIIDTDGAFVPTSLVRQSTSGKTEYFETYISAKNMNRLIRRNISKPDDEKESLAYEIAEKYGEHPDEFLELLYDESFHVSGTYRETWEFIMENGNSLKRYSNVSLFFEKLGIVLY